MKKTVFIAIGGMFLVLIVFIWQVAANLDSIMATAIEEDGSDALRTKVTVSGVSISLWKGKAGIGGLTIANPEGFSSANIFEMEGIEIDLNIASISEDVMVIESIIIQNPRIVFEVDDKGVSNLQTLLDGVDIPPAGKSEESDSKAPKIIIDHFEFTGGRVKITSALKPGEEMDVTLQPITMKGIGRAEGGVTAEAAMKLVTAELVSDVLEAAMKSEIVKAIDSQKRGFLDKLSEKLKGDG